MSYFRTIVLLCCVFVPMAEAAPTFKPQTPALQGSIEANSQALCTTAKNTLNYLNKGSGYDASVIHDGKVLPIPLSRIKATLRFICLHQQELNDPQFLRQHFEFIRWYPDVSQAQAFAQHKPLLQKLPANKILMTKYYVHLAKASAIKQPTHPYPLYGLPTDEQSMTLEEADKHKELIRFHYGKQAILKGALNNKSVPTLAFLSRDDLESALLQGTVVTAFQQGQSPKIFNVHRVNNIPYDRNKGPYQQERYWYFKEVDGVKGYGKDADNKITVDPKVTFAGDLAQLGLGKLLMIQYQSKQHQPITKLGILADTGGAFANNLYQVDYLAGAYAGKAAFMQGVAGIPDYVEAYFMVLKNNS
jgi:membrane-bound lytic murein transglycosylase